MREADHRTVAMIAAVLREGRAADVERMTITFEVMCAPDATVSERMKQRMPVGLTATYRPKQQAKLADVIKADAPRIDDGVRID